jgi:hypothetical protein
MCVEDETAAIEAFEGGAAIAIRCAAQAQREIRERLAAISHVERAAAAVPVTRGAGAVADRCIFGVGCVCGLRRWSGRAAGEQEQEKGDRSIFRGEK